MDETRLAARLRAAIMNQRIYPAGSRSVEQVVISVHQELTDCLRVKDTVSISRNENRFYVDKKEVPHSAFLCQALEEHQIQGISFETGCAVEEVRALVACLSEKRRSDRSFGDWLSGQGVTRIRVNHSRVLEVSEEEAVVSRGISQFHTINSAEEMRSTLTSALDFIDKIPEKTKKDALRQHLAERLVLMESTMLKDLFEKPLPEGETASGVLEDVLAAMHQNKVMEVFNEVRRWDQRIKSAGGSAQEMAAEREKLKKFVGQIVKAPSAPKVGRAVYADLVLRGLLDAIPEGASGDPARDLDAEGQRLLEEKDDAFLKGVGPGLSEFLNDLFGYGLQARAKDVVQRLRAILLEGESGARERAAQIIRRVLPILWTHLRDDLVVRLRDALLTGAEAERTIGVNREILGALADGLAHDYTARHTRRALEVAELLHRLCLKEDPSAPGRSEAAALWLRRAMDDLLDLVAEDAVSNDPEKREAAQGFLRHVDDVAIPVFIGIVLKSRDRALRRLAAESLKGFGAKGAAALAAELNMSNTSFALLNVLSVLDTVGGEEILGGLGTLVRYPDPDFRHAAVRILNRIPGEKACALAMRFLQDELESVRRLAAELLGERKHVPAVVDLIGLLNQTSSEELEVVCIALGRIGDPSAAEPVSRLLKEPKALFARGRSSRETVRIRAAWALAQMGPPARKFLVPFAEDPNPLVRQIAQE